MVFFFIVSSFGNKTAKEHGPGKEILSDVIEFENRYQVDYSIGYNSSAIVLNNITELLLTKSEKESAPHKNKSPIKNVDNHYIASIDEKEFKKVANQSYAYTFKLNLTDGRIYQIYIKTDPSYGSIYIATFIQRLDKTTKSTIYIDSKDDKINTEIKKWASDILKNNNFTIINKNSKK